MIINLLSFIPGYLIQGSDHTRGYLGILSVLGNTRNPGGCWNGTVEDPSHTVILPKRWPQEPMVDNSQHL